MSLEEKSFQPPSDITKIPSTLYEGFETKPPTDAERSGWDQAKVGLRRSHESNDNQLEDRDLDDFTDEQLLHQELAKLQAHELTTKRQTSGSIDFVPRTELTSDNEKGRFTKKQRLMGIIAGTALAFGLGGASVAVIANQGQTVAEAPPSDPTEAPTPTKTPIEQPTATPEVVVPATAEVVKGENEFDISNVEYAKVVNSLKIDLPASASSDQVYTAVSEKITKFLVGGQSMGERDAHFSWTSPTGDRGWNQWSTQLYSKALTEALFVDKYATSDLSVIDNFTSLKGETNRIWINTVKAQETPYKLEVGYTAQNTQKSMPIAGFIADGTLKYKGNAQESPTAASDSKSYNEMLLPNTRMTVVYTDAGWKVYQLFITP